MSFPTPSQIQEQYLQTLKSLKPNFNRNDKNSDFVIRGRAVSGLTSGLYGDQKKVNDDTYISSARYEALLLHGQDLGISQQPATAARSQQIRLTGTNGTVVSVGQITFLYGPTNVLYTNTTGGTVTAGILDVEIECLATGQAGNVIAPDTLQIVAPPTGINTTASVIQNIADGADIETVDSYRQRLLSRRQQPPAGGNEVDYPNFAFEADPSVRSAFIRRFGRGLGTVDVYITTGTTDVDTAVTQGIAISRIPSPAALAAVQAYYDSKVPLTDCPKVYGPIETNIDVQVKVVLAAGLTLASIPASAQFNPLNLTCQQLIEREVERVLYKVPVGGRLIPGFTSGFVTASDIEEGLDDWLSAVPSQSTGGFLGKIPILADRQCQPLDPPDVNISLSQNSLAAPGIITVTLGV